MGRTLNEKFREKLGYRHVPDNIVQVIFRDGRYHRAEGDTFVRCQFHNESFGPQVKIGIRVVENLYQNITSHDGVLHSIKVHVKVFFDLRQAEAVVAPLLAADPEMLIQSKVKGLVDLALRREVSQLDSARLLQPETPARLEGAIRKRLERNVDFMGVSLPEFEDALVVKEILPPERMQENRTETTNINETAHNLAQLTVEEFKQAIVALLYRDMGQRSVQVRAMNLPDAANPFKEDRESDHSLRVLRQPTGRIYDN